MSGDQRDNDDFDSLVFDSDQTESLRNKTPGKTARTAAEFGIVEYNDAAYLECYPDVGTAIDKKQFSTAFEHYESIGKKQLRLASPDYLSNLAGGVPESAGHGALSFNIDAAIISSDGTIFIVGWSDDRGNALRSVSVVQWDEGWNTRAIARCRRSDVEDLLQTQTGHSYGVWFVHQLPRFDRQRGAVLLRARFADGRFCQIEATPRVVSPSDLRDTILGHFAGLQYFGNRDIESFEHLDTGAGDTLVALNRSITTAITSAAHIERYGPARSKFAASFIVCLFGKVEYFFLQHALFSTGAGVAAVEFIYVSNSPELTELLQKEARIAERIYGISVTLVTLPGNAGFSAANNVAATFARSDRLVFINPDVFPRDNEWALRHAAIVATRPKEQTLLFGAPLYYDDGSLMHGGMYFEIDRGLSVKPDEIKASAMIRVEHFGKGAPAWSDKYTQSRPVPAVTGAFVSADRSWFESLGGFTEDYMFGHYEDADLCLKSLQRGGPVWLHDIGFWHLEGKGSIRRPPHEGGSLVNRWVFTRRWGKLVEEWLAGRTPRHPSLAGQAEPASLVAAIVPPAKTKAVRTATAHAAAPAAPVKPRRVTRAGR